MLYPHTVKLTRSRVILAIHEENDPHLFEPLLGVTYPLTAQFGVSVTYGGDTTWA